jgi:hypothetical protein
MRPTARAILSWPHGPVPRANCSASHARIAAEARLDGFYVIRTSVMDKTLAASGVVGL